MDRNYDSNLQKEINEKILNDLNQVDDVVEVFEFMSKFQHLSAINWKWVRSQNEKTELLLTEETIKNNGFELNKNPTATIIFVPDKKLGRRKFNREPRYDISQTNAKISDFSNRVHDYKTDEQREILSHTLNIAYDHLQAHFNEQASQVFATRDNLTDELKSIHSQLMSHVVSRYFGMDTTADIKPAIETWLNMNQNDAAKIKVIDAVHWESKNLIADIEEQLEPIRATMQSYDQYKKDTEKSAMDIKIEQPMFTKNLRENDVKREQPFSFDKLKKDLGLDDLEKVPTALVDYEYKESQGAYSFINFLDAVENQHPDLIKSQRVTARGFGNDGFMYDTVTNASYSLDDLQIEFVGADNVLRVHSNGKEKEYGLLNGSSLKEFDEFKKKILNAIDTLKPKEPMKNFDEWSHAVETASNVNLLEFAQANGYTFKKISQDRYNGIEHQSLAINPSINKFYYFSGDFGGDTIKFAREMMGISGFKEAVNYINSGNYGSFDKEAVQHLDVEKEPYVYDQRGESEDFSKAHHYLTHERKIDPKIVDYFLKNELIRQDTKGNIIFPYTQNGEIVGGSLQGTYIKKDGSTFKHIQPNSNGEIGFNYLNGSPKNLKFFEAPIDMLSYMSIHRGNPEKMQDTWFVAMGGLKQVAVQHYFRESQGHFAKVAVNELLQSKNADTATANATFKEKGVTPESIVEVLEKAGLSSDHFKTVQEHVATNFQSVSVCVDNGEKGHLFEQKIHKACEMFPHLEYENEIPDIPNDKAQEGVDEWDWNDERKYQVEQKERQVEVEISQGDYIPAELVSPEQISGQSHTQTGMEL